MGGMFTVVKVREGITTYADPGPYKNPPGTVAHKVGDDSARRSGASPSTNTCISTAVLTDAGMGDHCDRDRSRYPRCWWNARGVAPARRNQRSD